MVILVTLWFTDLSLSFFSSLPAPRSLVAAVSGRIPEPPVAITAQRFKQTLLTAKLPPPPPAPHPQSASSSSSSFISNVHSIVSSDLRAVFFLSNHKAPALAAIQRLMPCFRHTDRNDRQKLGTVILSFFLTFHTSLSHKSSTEASSSEKQNEGKVKGGGGGGLNVCTIKRACGVLQKGKKEDRGAWFTHTQTHTHTCLVY